MCRLLLSISFFSIVVIGVLKAQVSLVPANHQVYDWLHMQRVGGNLRYFSFESLPLSRGEISKLLNSLDKTQMNAIDQSQLNSYLFEFSMDSLKSVAGNTLLKGRSEKIIETWDQKWQLLKSSIEPHAYVHHDTLSTINVDYYYGSGIVNDRDLSRSTIYNFDGIRTYGTFFNRIGIYLEPVLVHRLNEMSSVQDIDYWGSSNGALENDNRSIYFEGMASLRYRKLSLDIGRGNLKYGVGNEESMIFRLKAPNFSWVRLKYSSKYFNYTFLHGSLDGTSGLLADTLNSQQAGSATLRWLSMRRFEIRPFKWINLGFTEVLSYSNRGIELAYINPIYPLRVSEFNRQDLDNPVWYLEGVIWPFAGIEMYATLGIDDLSSFSDVFHTPGNRSNESAVLLYQAGIQLAPKGKFHLNFEYVRIDPFFYTHKFHNNTFINSLKHEIPLAREIGPNSDQLYLMLRKWLPKRGWVKADFASVRKGLNPIDQFGAVTLNAGGDIGLGRNDGTTIVRFLSGDLHKYYTVGIEGYIEPWRGVGVSLNYRKRWVTQGSRMKNDTEFGARLLITFYPLTKILNPLFPKSI